MRVEDLRMIAMEDSDGSCLDLGGSLMNTFHSIRASGQAAVASRVSGSLLSYILNLDILN